MNERSEEGGFVSGLLHALSGGVHRVRRDRTDGEAARLRVVQRDVADTRDGDPLPTPIDPDERVQDLSRVVLRGALRSTPRGEDKGEVAFDAEVRTMMRQACDAAHECGWHAEQLVIMLKSVWRELPEAQVTRLRDGDEVLSRVITLCIDEYYPMHRRP